MVAEVVSHLPAASDPQVRFELDIPPDLPPLLIAPDFLSRVFQELLANACESLPGAGTVEVSARRTQVKEADCLDLFGTVGPGEVVEIQVADTGSGLSPEARQNVLSSLFFSTKPRHRGLGLATVYRILGLHAGGLRLDPRPGGGTIVRLVLPLDRPPVSSGLEKPSPLAKRSHHP